MKTRALAAAAILALAAPARAASVPTPSEFLGMTVGADRTVADYRQILAYFRALDTASARVEVEILGQTTLGEDLFLAAISSETNLANKKRLQEIARRIADPRGPHGGRVGGARPRGEGLPLHHLQHPLDRDRRVTDGHGVGVRARHRRRTRRRGGASTRWSSCSCPRSTPTGRSWRPSGTGRTSARATRAGGCGGLYHPLRRPRQQP